MKIMAITILVIALLGTLLMKADMPNRFDNGFGRRFNEKKPGELKHTDFAEPVNAIRAISGNYLYLTGEKPTGILLMKKDLSFKDTLNINLQVGEDKLVPAALFIDSPNLYLHINNLKTVVYGGFPGKKLSYTEVKSQLFTKSVQISPVSMIIRSFDKTGRNQVFQKVNIISGEVVKEASITSDKGDDIGIASDGNLLYNQKIALLSYAEYFRNRFYLIDTNLNVKLAGRTIDTIATIDIKKQMQKEEDGRTKITPDKARIKVNKGSFMDEIYLYVISALRADNESRSDFNEHSVIDRYKLIDGKYSNSFYINKIKEKPFKSAMITGDTLFTLYNNKMVLYKLPK